MGFVHGRREGKQVFYACAPGRVRADPRPDGMSLTVTNGSGAAVTVTVPLRDVPESSAERAAPPPAAGA